MGQAAFLCRTGENVALNGAADGGAAALAGLPQNAEKVLQQTVIFNDVFTRFNSPVIDTYFVNLHNRILIQYSYVLRYSRFEYSSHAE